MASMPAPPRLQPDPPLDGEPVTVVVPVRDFLAGRLPAVCARTGGPATVNLRRQGWMAVSWLIAVAVPVWLGLSLFLEYRVSFALGAGLLGLGVVMVAVAARRTRPIVIGSLPVCAGLGARARRLRTVAGDLALGWIAAWLAAIAFTLIAGEGAATFPLELALAAGGAALLAGSGLALLLEARAIGVSVRLYRDRSGNRWVRLRGVHPAFAAAIEAGRRSRR
jgi:hypothetical protein